MTYRHQLHTQEGFTLIELMIVTVVVAIMTGAGVFATARFNERQGLKTAVEDVMTQLRVVQKQADGAEKPAGCLNLVGYQVDFSSITPSLANVRVICTPAISPDVVGTINLMNNAQLNFIGTRSVRFRPLSQPAVLTPSGSSLTIPFVSSGGTFSSSVVVELGGNLRVTPIIP